MIRVLRRILGRARLQYRAWADRQRAAAELRGLSDRDLGDIALGRSEIDAVAAGTYEDPREAIFAAREHARTEAAARAAAAAAVRRIAA